MVSLVTIAFAASTKYVSDYCEPAAAANSLYQSVWFVLNKLLKRQLHNVVLFQPYKLYIMQIYK